MSGLLNELRFCSTATKPNLFFQVTFTNAEEHTPWMLRIGLKFIWTVKVNKIYLRLTAEFVEVILATDLIKIMSKCLLSLVLQVS